MSIRGKYGALFDQDDPHGAVSTNPPSFMPSRNAPPRGPRPRTFERDVPLQTDDKPPTSAVSSQREGSRFDYKQPGAYLSPEVDHILSLFKNKRGFEQLIRLELTQVRSYADILDAVRYSIKPAFQSF